MISTGEAETLACHILSDSVRQDSDDTLQFKQEWVRGAKAEGERGDATIIIPQPFNRQETLSR